MNLSFRKQTLLICNFLHASVPFVPDIWKHENCEFVSWLFPCPPTMMVHLSSATDNHAALIAFRSRVAWSAVPLSKSK